ncbi:MAG: lamin tail domain-containing protein, partial [Planctomycetota bacterium]|nr:lamin tail domain-containing protein [Planctomycetota bacterium]
MNGGLGSNARYLQVAEVLDLPHSIDYMIMNFYGSNADWPSHNWYAARRRIPGGQFQFYSWDAERILEDRNSNRTGVSNGDSPGVVYSRLRANDEFRLLFADRAHRHLFGAGALTPRAVAARWTARKNELFTAVTAESARWGDYRRDVHRSSNGPYEFYRRSTHWFPEHDRLEKSYFPARTRVLLGQLRSNGLYPAVGAPEMNRTGGEVTPGFTLILRLPRGTSGQIYVTLDGTDPRVFGTGGDVSPGAMEYVNPLVLNDLAHVKARTLSGGTWSALAEALFTVVGPRDALRVTEIMYNPPEGSTHEFLELRNTASVTVGLGGLRFSKGLNYTFPEGASLGPGEFWVLGSDEAAFASKYPGVGLDGVYLGSLANGGERLTIADGKAGGMAGGDGESVLTLVYDDEDFWPLGADGLGWSLVLGNEDAPASEPESWRASAARGGSPGAEDGAPVASGVWINEVLTGSTAPLEDAVELFNAGSRPADVGGWYLSDSRLTEERLKKYRIPSGTVIPSGGYLVIYEAEFNSDPGSPASFALDRGGDDVYLSSSDPAGELTGYVVGHDFGAAEDGVSLGRVETSVGPDFAALRERTFGVDEPGTVEEFRMGRGVANALPLVGEVVLNELHYNPAAGVEFVELHNRSGEVVSLYDEALGRGWRLTGVRNPEGTDDYEFEVTAELAPGGYLLVVPVDPQLFRSLRLVPAEVPVAGPFRGRLDNGGESIRLRRPVEEDGQVVYVSVDRVRYDDGPPWPSSADGGGPSLERVEASGYGNEPQNWDASAAPGGTPGVQNSVSRPGENQRPRASFVARGGAGPLEAEFDASASRDKDGVITSFVWDFGDGDGGSGEVVRHLYASPGVYTVRLEVTDDLGARSSAVRSVEVADDPGGGRQVPADANQDGS